MAGEKLSQGKPIDLSKAGTTLRNIYLREKPPIKMEDVMGVSGGIANTGKKVVMSLADEMRALHASQLENAIANYTKREEAVKNIMNDKNIHSDLDWTSALEKLNLPSKEELLKEIENAKQLYYNRPIKWGE